MADSSGMTLMDLISSDPSSTKPPSSSSTAPPPDSPVSSSMGPPVPVTVDRKSKRGALMQIQSDPISAAKAAFNPVRTNIMPQKQKKKERTGGSRYRAHEGHGSPIREEPPPYTSPVHQSYESFENPLAGPDSHSFGFHDGERTSSGNSKSGSALYDFTAGGDDELNLTAGEEVEIEYEVDGWFYVKKKHPGRDGKMVGLVPVLYVSQF